MKQKIVYFALGVLFSLTVAVLAFSVLVFHEYHAYTAEEVARDVAEGLQPKPLVLTQEDLVGTWRGKEGWGKKFEITRRADGTFTETLDTRESDAGPNRKYPILKYEGRWSYWRGIYSQYYTKCNDPSEANTGPYAVAISARSKKEFIYQYDEGNGISEEKK